MRRELLCGVTLASLLVTPAWTQTVADDDSTLTEVIVTARKRDERLQEIPAAGSSSSAPSMKRLTRKSRLSFACVAGRSLAARRARERAPGPSRRR